MTDQARFKGQRSVRRRFRYRVDNVLSRGVGAPLLVLGGITVIVVLVSAAVLTAFSVSFAGEEDTTWLEGFWQSVLRLMDPGTMADDVGWWARIIALMVTVVGILIVGTLIGVIASGVEQRVEGLRRGRSPVDETGHVLILGESGRLPMVVRQLALANRGRRANAIVVLADDETGDLDDDVRAAAGDLHGSRLVFRRGDPARAADLERVGIRDARSVIVLADEDAHGDAGVVMAVLAAGTELGAFDRVPIVAELDDPETGAALLDACGGVVYPVAGVQVVGRYTAFALREPGLNQVVGELLDFRGADLYVRETGDLAGLRFRETLFRFPAARPIGRMTSNGAVELNPDPDLVLGESDRLVLIAEDAGRLTSTPAEHPSPVSSTSESHQPLHTAERVERMVIIGWNRMGALLLEELDPQVAPGSTVEIVYDPGLFDPEEIGLDRLERFEVRLTPTKALTWQLDDAARASELTSIVLLGYRRGMSIGEADSRTLLNLMRLRRQLDAWTDGAPRVVVELLDADKVDLHRGKRADDYVISDAIVSRILTQVAEQPERRAIMFSLYATDGPSVHLVESEALGLHGDTGFDDVITAAYSAGLLAIGWRRGSDRDGELVLNPATSRRVDLQPDDQIVVIG
ncbi:MAG: CASTOR/POLLUX-related putative ion channel [Ilumatobacteraceae bacterium]